MRRPTLTRKNAKIINHSSGLLVTNNTGISLYHGANRHQRTMAKEMERGKKENRITVYGEYVVYCKR
jgi:hypothetical protein